MRSIRTAGTFPAKSARFSITWSTISALALIADRVRTEVAMSHALVSCPDRDLLEVSSAPIRQLLRQRSTNQRRPYTMRIIHILLPGAG
jgi:hypothetical protein